MDHLNRPSLRAVTREMWRRGAPAPIVVVPPGVEDLVSDLGFSQVLSLEWWHSLELPQPSIRPIRITATPARHWGARLFKDVHRGFGGYVIEAQGSPSIYHAGDTAYFDGFGEIGRRLRPEIALLPIGAYYPDSYRSVHTSPEEALRGFLDMGAKLMVPMHYKAFRLGREPVEEPLARLLTEAKRVGMSRRIRPLEAGGSLIIAEGTEYEASQQVEASTDDHHVTA